MAAISPKEGVDLKALYAHMAANLPAYARPVFVRFQAEAETTGTLKYRKVDLVRDGFDPMNTSDKLFVVDGEAKSYRPITTDVHRDIVSGKIRL
jgi:fatty-acyl-CoA synthase